MTALVDGRAHGTTVSAFTSLSMDPPMVMVALDTRSDLRALLRTRHRFGVDILVAAQWEHAVGFARKGSDEFDVTLGTVVAARPAAAEPLTHHDRGFGTHVAHARIGRTA